MGGGGGALLRRTRGALGRPDQPGGTGAGLIRVHIVIELPVDALRDRDRE
jgi:hypothetical protein